MLVKESCNNGVNMRMDLERAKRIVRVDRSFTCFKGVGSVSKDLVSRCMWLCEEKKQREYM